MKTRVAIYGFDRLGRAIYHIASRRRDLEVVMVVTDDSAETLVASLMQDVVYATLEDQFEVADGGFRHQERHVHIRSVSAFELWKEHNIDIVIDAHTKMPSAQTVEAHQYAGVKRVVFGSVCPDVKTIVYGVNDAELQVAESAISGGGAERAAVEPVFEMIDALCGREKSLITTVEGHVCSCQNSVCDTEHTSLHPETSTDARLPAPKLVATLSEVVVYAKKTITTQDLIEGLQKLASEPYYQGIVTTSIQPVDPEHVIGESASCVIDLSRTSVVDKKLISLKLWYDREWGYANRLVELTADFGKVKY